MGLLAQCFVLSLLACLCSAHRIRRTPLLEEQYRSLAPSSLRQDLLSKCDKHWFTTHLDHFTWAKGPDGQSTFQMRYYVCAEHRQPEGPIFFYLGNEADVLLYLNATGLMWENAESFGATLIFAEHRYYGESLPFGDDTSKHMQWLTSEQALADYALLIDWYRHENNIDVPVIGFGGSYGGMLATWGRLKYPHIWAGVIAGSAPIWTFEHETPEMDPEFYAKGVTYDATPEAGAVVGCSEAIRDAWQAMMDLAEKEGGLQDVSEALRICPHVRLNSTQNVTDAREWAAAAFDMMAMGNYPYPSSYMLNGHGELPAWPMRAACANMMAAASAHGGPSHRFERGGAGIAARKLLASDAAHRLQYTDQALLEGLASAISVWYNFTGTLSCFNPWKGVNKETAHDGDYWSYQYCTEEFMPFQKSGVADMFYPQPFNETAAIESCHDQWGVRPRVHWPNTEWGDHHLEGLSNVVFSNGLYDPWHGGGVLTNLSGTVTAVIIEEGAHHLDLMFSHEDDPECVKRARAAEVDAITDWIHAYRPSKARTEHVEH